MGPTQDRLNRSGLQAPICVGGWRHCLLKGCGILFKPNCARRRYCSATCQSAARYWRQWKAQRRYRSSEKGRARRREQSRRWRARQGEEQQRGPTPPPDKASEGHPSRRRRNLGKKVSCDRPGCYEGFDHRPRSPWQRFCSALCQAALRLAHLRDRRWQGVCHGCAMNALEPCMTRVRGP